MKRGSPTRDPPGFIMGANSRICKLCICFKIIKYIRRLRIPLIDVRLSAVREPGHNNECGPLPLKTLDTHGTKCVYISSISVYFFIKRGNVNWIEDISWKL